MAVIHIFKDGTVKKDLKNVYVPKEIVESIAKIAKERKEKKDGH